MGRGESLHRSGSLRHVGWIVAVVGAGVSLLLRSPVQHAFGSVTPSASAIVSQSDQPDLDRALQAELSLYPGAVVLSDPAACDTTSDPLGAACIRVKSDEQSAERGIAVFTLEYPVPGSPTTTKEVLGRASDGTWLPWFSTSGQIIYQLLTLPGSLLVCSRGQLADLHTDPFPSAKAVNLLTDGAALSAERFVLTRPGSFSGPQPPSGDVGGWYQISAPQPGWVPSQLVTDAGLGTCSWHDALMTTG